MTTTMNEHLDRYLAQREAFGTGLSRRPVRDLGNFAAFATAKGQSHITTALYQRWQEQSARVSQKTWSNRLSHVWVFARWLQSLEPACEIPPRGLVQGHYRRPAPYIYSDEEIIKIVREASKLPSANGLRGITCSTLLGLLAATGLRHGEALGLDDGDVDTDECVIHVRKSKNGSERAIPITSCTAERLVGYQILRDRVWGVSSERAFFRSWLSDRRLQGQDGRRIFARVGQIIGLREKRSDGRTGKGPRIHDLRHTFATRTIIRWLRTGRNPDHEIYKLTTFLGHKLPCYTYWYLEAVPEIMTLTMRQAEKAIGYGREDS